MQCQCHFGKVKASVDTGAVATLHYAIYRSENNGRHIGYDHTNVVTPPRFYLYKSEILECIQIAYLSWV